MQKCLRCKVVFHSEERVRCLYCDSLMVSVTHDDGPEFESGLSSESTLLEQIIRNRRITEENQFAYILSNYFRIRSYHFMYAFSRQEFKMGREFKRFFVQPMSSVFLLIMPWALVDLVDSLLIRLTHNGYCEKCRWKYQPKMDILGHDARECAYNNEYAAIVKDIVSGRILMNEETYRQEGLAKLNRGERSAYFDLCNRESYHSTVVDMTFVGFSVLLMIGFLVWLFLPTAIAFMRNLD